MRLVVGISGASGSIYGIRLLDVLRGYADVETHLIVSNAGKLTISLETEYRVSDVEAMADIVHRNTDIGASVASGSFKTEAMVIAPCSMRTLSSVTNSYSDNLISRAADVILKERRQLILMPRETPLHIGHCRLLVRAAELGCVIAPPMPAFYTKPDCLDDMINHSVGRILDLLGLDTTLVDRWPGITGSD